MSRHSKKVFGLKPAAFNTLVTLGIVFFMGLWFMGNYNSLVSSQTAVEKSWASVETQYQRRFDLIGNLVESVKGGQKQELAVFSKIADARKQYSSASSIHDKAEAVNSIETNMALIPKLQEAYPDLKSNALVTSLMSDLRSTEDVIAKSRDTYNTTATNYNKNIRSFPKNIFSSMFGFEKVPLFKSSQNADKAVEVKF